MLFSVNMARSHMQLCMCLQERLLAAEAAQAAMASQLEAAKELGKVCECGTAPGASPCCAAYVDSLLARCGRCCACVRGVRRRWSG